MNWGELDYLLIDLPPGTGDAQITIVQESPICGVVMVTTPQQVAVSDVRRSVHMFRQVGVPVLGLVENMSYLLCGHCGEPTPHFRFWGRSSNCHRTIGAPVGPGAPSTPASANRAIMENPCP